MFRRARKRSSSFAFTWPILPNCIADSVINVPAVSSLLAIRRRSLIIRKRKPGRLDRPTGLLSKKKSVTFLPPSARAWELPEHQHGQFDVARIVCQPPFSLWVGVLVHLILGSLGGVFLSCLMMSLSDFFCRRHCNSMPRVATESVQSQFAGLDS